MVSPVTPSQPHAVPAEFRAREFTQPNANAAGASGIADVVSVRGEEAAGWRAARASIGAGLAALDTALAAGREAADALSRLSNGADDESSARLAALLEDAVLAGNALLKGGALRVSLEPGAPPIEIEGIDLAALVRGDDPAEAAAHVQEGLERWRAAAQRLSAHDGFLAAIEQSVSAHVRTDLNADGARLLALQVRQDLSLSGAALSSGGAESVLGLFRG